MASVSCIIRTFNEAEYVGDLIKKLYEQASSSNVDFEIIVVDSGSTDLTPQIAKKLGTTLIEIPREGFNYSKSLNLGIEKCMGDLILIVSAHILPREDNWLTKILSDFSSEEIAGVYCRQVPWANADWREVLRLEKQFGTDSNHFADDSHIEKLCFSNAASCIRKSVWKKHPFAILPAAEDREWALWAIQNGYTIIYEAGVSAYHSHNEAPRQAARRLIEIAKAADVRLGRKRTRLVTFKQACGLGLRELKMISILTCCKGKRLASFIETFAKSFWYMVDFN